MRSRIGIVTLTLGLTLAPSLRAQAGKPDQRSECTADTVDRYGPEMASKARAFLAELRDAVKADNRGKVAALASYPFHVYSPYNDRLVEGRRDFIRNYQRILVKDVRKEILDEKSSRCLFANYQGFMVGNGAVWFRELSPGVLKIVTINIPSTTEKRRY